MSAVSELLSNCGLQLESEIYSDDGYYLCRVDYQGRKFVAEISSTTSLFYHRWPSVTGLIRPVSERDLPNQHKLLLFDTGNGRFLCELLKTTGGLSKPVAVSYVIKALSVVSRLQSSGMISGYIGPEMFVINEASLFMLAGRRGVPKSPFTAPEVRNSRPSDPRSDVSAIGSFFFRLLAGTDDQAKQVSIWQNLDAHIQSIIQEMVAKSPIDRPASLSAVSEILIELADKRQEEGVEGNSNQDDKHSGFIKKSKSESKSSAAKKWYWIGGSVVVLVLSIFAFINSGLPEETTIVNDNEEILDVEQLQGIDQEDSVIVSPWESSESVTEVETVVEDDIASHVFLDSAIVWVSNCTGSAGLEQDFRAEAASSFSFVYPLVGTSNRQTSIILVRRGDPTIPIAQLPIGQIAFNLATSDTSFVVKPVDLTVMLGLDLNYSGLNAHFLHSPENPSDTLFVDVVNHGIQYPLDGLGAATWFASKIDGRAVDHNEEEYLILVSDIRDADKFNEEINIPEVLNETCFFMKESNVQAAYLETILRQFFQPLPATSNLVISEDIMPDIHVLLGQNTN